MDACPSASQNYVHDFHAYMHVRLFLVPWQYSLFYIVHDATSFNILFFYFLFCRIRNSGHVILDTASSLSHWETTEEAEIFRLTDMSIVHAIKSAV